MLEAVVLGILQGLTEFIPVSSSAHLILLPWFFDWQGTVSSLTFGVALHFGTLMALLVFFRRDWILLVRTAGRKDALLWHILLATIPAALAGFFFHDQIEQIRSPLVITLTLILVGLFMILAEKRKGGSEGLGMESMTRRDALIIGIAQACALVPGVSRSGITIVAGLARGYERQASARFSFLLSTPIVAGASLLEARALIQSSAEFAADLFLTGIIVSALTGYGVIKYLLRFLQNHRLNPFAYYRFFLAFVIIITLLTQR